ncbi:MAG: hypothetical protein HETSPECPRED_006937 [Heterodermia speciosa]|uniref:Uncharacterized protein n=1 Tax=Heterodermia speciosa TaxID=116794 RepID=A0A8H3IRG6_9LECA|nr:MAG: hypothetical protein HETSPECPRED_006937 [Heterodermia speciosa]
MAAQLSEIGTHSLPITTTQTSSPSHHQIQLQEPSTPSLGQRPRASTYQLREESAIVEEPETALEPRPLARATSESSRPASLRSIRSKSGFKISRKPVPGFLGRHSGITQGELHQSFSFSVEFPRSSSLGRHSIVVQQEEPDVNLFIGTSANEPKASRKVPAYTPLRIRQEYLVTMSSDNVTVVGSEAASLAGTTIAPAIRRAATMPPVPNKTGMVYPATAGSLGQQICGAGQHEQSKGMTGNYGRGSTLAQYMLISYIN